MLWIKTSLAAAIHLKLDALTICAQAEHTSDVRLGILHRLDLITRCRHDNRHPRTKISPHTVSMTDYPNAHRPAQKGRSITRIIPHSNDIAQPKPFPQQVDGNDARAQTKQIMEYLKLILAEGGATLQAVVYVHVYFLHS